MFAVYTTILQLSKALLGLQDAQGLVEVLLGHVTRHDDLLGGLGVRNQLTPGCCFRVRVSLDEPGPALKVAIAAIFTLQKMHGSAEALGQDPLGVLETCGFQGAQGEAKDQSPIISRDNCLAGTM